MRTVRRFCRSSNLLLCVVGLAVVSYSLVAFLHLQSDATRPESDHPVHHRILLTFDVATNSSPKLHLENLTARSSNSSDRPTITVREADSSSVIILNETVQGEVNSTETTTHSPARWSVPETCEKQNCAEFLSREEKCYTSRCAKQVAVELPGYKIQSSTCKFLPGIGRPPVMLSSAEGSGNTWVRGLLEEATGVCTGFEWCDAAMRAHGFIGEGVASGKVLVVKTHESIPKWRDEVIRSRTPASIPKWRDENEDSKLYDSAVFLLRNPARSMIAERNRLVTKEDEERKDIPRNGSHTNVVSKDMFGMLQL